MTKRPKAAATLTIGMRAAAPSRQERGQGERARRSGAKASPLFVGSVEKALRVLRAFDGDHRTLSLTEMTAATGLDKSAAQRFSHTLYALGYLRKDAATRRYSLAPKILELGFGYLRTDALMERAMPLLAESSKECEETVNLTELDGTEVVYVARFPSRHVVSVDILLGTRLPAYCTAPGQAMLAFLPDGQAEEIIDRSRLVSATPNTLADKPRLMRRLAEIRRLGYALADQECFVGDISTAAPVFDYSDRVVAAVNIAVPASRWTAERVRAELSPVIVRTAEAVSRAQGGEAPRAARAG